MSFASYQFFCENATQYIGSFSRSGLRAVLRVELARRARAHPAACGTPRTRPGTRGQRARRRMRVEVAFAGDRALAADVQRFERVELAGVRNADAHAELLLHAGIGDGRLHAAELDRQAACTDRSPARHWRRARSRRELERLAGANDAARRRDRRAVLGDQRRAHAVVGPGALDIALHDALARRGARFDRGVRVRDGRLFDGELALRSREARCKHCQRHDGRREEHD